MQLITILADYNTAYDVGYWVIPALIGIWGIVMIVKKIKQGIEDTEEIDKKTERLSQNREKKQENNKQEDNKDTIKEQIKELREQNKKLATKIDELEKQSHKKDGKR